MGIYYRVKVTCYVGKEKMDYFINGAGTMAKPLINYFKTIVPR